MRQFAFKFLAAIALLFVAVPASAQVVPSSFGQTASPVSLSVSNSSSRVAFPSPGPTALIINTGANAAYLNFGGTGVVATTSSALLGPGCSVAYDVNGQADLAAITASSTTTLQIISGYGLPTLPPNSCTLSATIAGGTVTANQGTPNAGGTASWWTRLTDNLGNAITSTFGLPVTGTEYTSSPNHGSVTTHGTFVSALASNASRHGCTIQNTSTDTLYFEAIATGSATTANSFQVPSGGFFYCNVPQGVLTDNIATTSSTLDGATFVVNTW